MARNISSADELSRYLQGKSNDDSNERDELSRERLELEREKIALRREELQFKREQAQAKQRPPNDDKQNREERRSVVLAIIATAPVLISIFVLLYVLVTT